MGSALVEAAEEMAAALGRREIGGMDQVPVRPGYHDAATPFARVRGFAAAQLFARRELRLPPDTDRLRALRESVAESASGYNMMSFAGPWPAAFMDDRCELGRRMSIDVPKGDYELDEEIWDEQRVRRIEATLAAQNRVRVATAAQDTASGRLVGFTEVAVPLGAPESVWQLDTLVRREHRGHGLGVALKLANTLALTAAYPKARAISTWNATENAHMIAINEQMGFEVTATSTYWLKKIERMA